jgi:hypothetical protein
MIIRIILFLRFVLLLLVGCRLLMFVIVIRITNWMNITKDGAGPEHEGKSQESLAEVLANRRRENSPEINNDRKER